MKTPPDYFDDIRNNEIKWWNDHDPSNPNFSETRLFNGFTYQFKTVKRPEYVISELLQNADDAGAKSVSINIENRGGIQRFIFGHDGNDFEEAEFRALCSFSESSKGNKLTTGYRGIGFKSTFSLSDIVYLVSPSLSVFFKDNDEREFTIPKWTEILLPDEPNADKKTYVIIPLKGAKNDLLKTINAWKTSIDSIFFFKNIRKIEIDGKIFETAFSSLGPVKNTEWIVKYSGEKKVKFLKIKSEDIPIPDNVLSEICRERKTNVADYQNLVISIELLLGDTKTDNRLYATLPTEETTCLPVSINAPFILNTERNKLETDSETKQTNRWIFENIGALIKDVLSSWLKNEKLTLSDRAEAYRLLPTKTEAEGTFENIVLERIQNYVDNNPIVLDCDGKLVSHGIVVPDFIYDLWDTKTLRKFYSLLDSEYILSQESELYHSELEAWKLITYIETIGLDNTIQCFSRNNVPIPDNLNKLLTAVNHIVSYGISKRNLPKIFPTLRFFKTEKSDRLYALNEILLPYERYASLPEEYKELIKRHVIFADEKWMALLQSGNYLALKEYWMDYQNNKITSTDEELIKYLADHCSTETTDEDLILVAHLAAYLSVKVPKSFPYITHDNVRHLASDSILYDPEKILSSLISEKDASLSLLFLNEKYHLKEDPVWENWVVSDKSRVARPFEIEFLQDDYIFKGNIIEKLEDLCERNKNYESTVWANVLEYLLKNQTGIVNKLSRGDATKASWIVTLSQKPCVYGDDNKTHVPSGIYYKTDVTKLLTDEIFLDSAYPADFESLYMALGVRFKPGTPHGLLNKLIRYSQERFNDIKQIISDYTALSLIISNVDKDAENEIKNYFSQNPIIFTSSKEWKNKNNVYKINTELPGTYLLFPALAELSLWKVVHLEDKPSHRDIVEYLKTLPINAQIPEKQFKFIISFINRNPDIYHSLRRWINLDYEWKDIGDFEYYLPEEHFIHNIVREWKCNIPKLSIIEDKFKRKSLIHQHSLKNLFDIISWKPINIDMNDAEECVESWMQTLGNTLLSKVPENSKYYTEALELGTQLINTKIFKVNSFSVAPFIDDDKIGDGIVDDFYWDQHHIYYLKTLKKARKSVSFQNAISKNYCVDIENQDLINALQFSIDRDDETIIEFCTGLFDCSKGCADNSDNTEFEDRFGSENQNDEVVNEGAADSSDLDNNSADIAKPNTKNPQSSDVKIPIEESLKKQDTHSQIGDASHASDDAETSFSGINNVDKRSKRIQEENEKYLSPNDNSDAPSGDDDTLNDWSPNDKKGSHHDTFGSHSSGSGSGSHSSGSGSGPHSSGSGSGPHSSGSGSGPHSSGSGSHPSGSGSGSHSSGSGSGPHSSGSGSHSSGSGSHSSGSGSHSSDASHISDPEKKRRHDMERSFLYQEYRGKCQICGRNGFEIAEEHLWQYPVFFKAINLIKSGDLDDQYQLTEGTDAWNSLSLCPDCAAKYKYGVKNISSIDKQIDEIDKNCIRDEPILLHIILDNIPRTITYSPKHFLALKETFAQLKQYPCK